MIIMDNKKGGVLGFIFFLICFIAVWAFWLGTFLQEWGQTAITTNSLTGLEAFFYANLNLWIFLCLLAGTFLYFYFGGGTQ